MKNKPIGVFDSGIGGLTVLNEIMNILPNESILYFGDCGRAPYGNKSKEMITKYALQNCRFLQSIGVKMIVVACNTASACSIDILKKMTDVPVIDVVQPSAKRAIRETRNKRIGVIGTNATINSAVYKIVIEKIDKSHKVFSKACPLFVPLVEEGWWDNDIVQSISDEYLTSLKEQQIDTLVLGCTHYPLISNTIQKTIGDNIRCVNSAREVAQAIKEKLESEHLTSELLAKPYYKYYTSDNTDKFKSLAGMILNTELEFVKWVDIDNY
jgi:glutamate racemase